MWRRQCIASQFGAEYAWYAMSDAHVAHRRTRRPPLGRGATCRRRRGRRRDRRTAHHVDRAVDEHVARVARGHAAHRAHERREEPAAPVADVGERRLEPERTGDSSSGASSRPMRARRCRRSRARRRRSRPRRADSSARSRPETSRCRPICEMPMPEMIERCSGTSTSAPAPYDAGAWRAEHGERVVGVLLHVRLALDHREHAPVGVDHERRTLADGQERRASRRTASRPPCRGRRAAGSRTSACR